MTNRAELSRKITLTRDEAALLDEAQEYDALRNFSEWARAILIANARARLAQKSPISQAYGAVRAVDKE